MKKLSLVFLVAMLSTGALAQSWTRYESRHFSFSLPEDALVYRSDGTTHKEMAFLASTSGASFKVTLNEETSGKSAMKYSAENDVEEGAKFSQFKFNGFDVLLGRWEGKNYNLVMYVASSAAIYSVWISAPSKDHDDVKQFLGSIALQQKPIFNQSSPVVPTGKTLDVKAVQSSDRVEEALKHEQKHKVGVRSGSACVEKIDRDIAYSRQLLLLTKPRPRYTDDARQNNVQGTVELQVRFMGNGDIGSICAVKGLRRGLTEQAVEAAKRIKFVPAEIGGQPADVVRRVTYTFSIY